MNMPLDQINPLFNKYTAAPVSEEKNPSAGRNIDSSVTREGAFGIANAGTEGSGVPAEPSVLPRLAAIAAGAGAGAALQGQNMLHFRDVPGDIKSSATNAVEGQKLSIGKPLTKWELMTQEGQIAEIERLKMRDMINQLKGNVGVADIKTQGLTTQQEAAQRALELSRAEEQVALANHVRLGGGKTAPEPRLNTAMRTVGGANVLVPTDTVDYHAMNPSPTGGSAAKEIAQHESAHFRSLSQGEQERLIDQLARERGIDRGYARIMLEAGQHNPTVTGRVLLPAKDLRVINANQTPAQQMEATLTVEERAARDAAARRLAQEQLINDLRFNESDRVLREAQAARSGATSGATGAENKLLSDVSTRGVLTAEGADKLAAQQADMIRARADIPKIGTLVNMGARAAPIAFGVANAAGTADLAYDSFWRNQNHDPVGALIAGVGSAAEVPTMLRRTLGGALLGIGVDIGTRAGLDYYDKHAHEIHQILQKNFGTPKDWDPTTHSVMDNYK